MPNDDAVGKGGWGVENVSKSDGVILGRSLRDCSSITAYNLKHFRTVDDVIVEQSLRRCKCKWAYLKALLHVAGVVGAVVVRGEALHHAGARAEAG